VTEQIEVTGTTAVLQLNDSSVINTLTEQSVLKLPNPTRSLESLQFNQPLAVPYVGGADSNRTRAGSVAGARTDQNTYILDGADVSDNIVGDGFLETLPSAIVPLPADCAYLFDMFVCRSARGRNVAALLRNHVHGLLAEKGVRNAISVSLVFNKSTRKFKAKLGSIESELRLLLRIKPFTGLDVRLHRKPWFLDTPRLALARHARP